MVASGENISLGRAEALERAATVTVTQMGVELDLTQGDSHFGSTTTLRFEASGPETFVDFKGDQLLAATLNGVPVEGDRWRSGRIRLSGLAAHNTLVVQGRMAYSSDGEGLHRHVDPADQQAYLYAMSFLDAAPRWFACFDQPDLKAPYELSVTAPANWTVIGNGPSEAVSPGRWVIRPPRPLSTYFVTLVAGPYASVLDEHDGIRLGFHVRASLAEALRNEAADLIAVTRAAFDYFHRVFGVRYPFGEYHQAFVPDFNAGAMENPGCVTLRDQYIYRARATRSERAHRAGTVVHEMAHMWFGDLVTMKWWDDLWLNESFAEYMAHRACEETGEYSLWTEFGIVRKDWGSVADQAPSTHPVAGNGSRDAESALQDFDGISYAKGAAVLKQLVTYLGDEVFFAGLRRYFTAYAFGNAEFDDLMAAWTEAGAVNLHDWAAAWLRTSGLDTIDVVPGHRTAMITSTPPPGEQVTRTHALQVGAVDDEGRVFARTAVQLAGQPVGVEVPAGVELLIPDVGDDTWAKIRFGPGAWLALERLLARLADRTARVVVFNSIRDAVRNAELAPARALELLCGAAPSEPSEVILGSTMDFALEQLAGPYSPPGHRPGRRRQVHETVRTVLEEAPYGSDQQLLAFRQVIASCDDVEPLQQWLDAARLPAGIELDPELRWAMVTRLSGLTGDAGLIERTLTEDPSGLALSHAAQARAALPTVQAKEAAWQLLMQPASIGAYELYATARGFFDPGQSELTAAYAPRYFDEIVSTASFRAGWALGRVALLAFPVEAATEENLARAERTLERSDLAAPLRRSLTDGTDQLRRAVRALGRFPSEATPTDGASHSDGAVAGSGGSAPLHQPG
jgi:aminopeptidase N